MGKNCNNKNGELARVIDSKIALFKKYLERCEMQDCHPKYRSKEHSSLLSLTPCLDPLSCLPLLFLFISLSVCNEKRVI